MTTNIERLIVFGDSMSDIGIKGPSHWGRLAAAINEMRVNAMMRFSDNRNWTDFIWEWAGSAPLPHRNAAESIERSKKHLEWHMRASDGSANGTLSYANYAEGGAMGASDRPKTGCYHFEDQVKRYKADLEKYPPKGEGLYLVWFGLNDFVTNQRPADQAGTVAKHIVDQCIEISKVDSHSRFLVANCPNPRESVRFLLKDVAKMTDPEHHLADAAKNFDKALDVELRRLRSSAKVDILKPMGHVYKHLGLYDITGLAQDKEPDIPCWYDGKPDRKYEKAVRRMATSDEGHPTEAVYELIARLWAVEILKTGEVGLLRRSGKGTFTYLT